MEGSTQGSVSDTNAGDAVTITCQDNHVLEGNSDLTCTIDGSWSSNAPKCTRKGKSFSQFHGTQVSFVVLRDPPRFGRPAKPRRAAGLRPGVRERGHEYDNV